MLSIVLDSKTCYHNPIQRIIYKTSIPGSITITLIDFFLPSPIFPACAECPNHAKLYLHGALLTYT